MDDIVCLEDPKFPPFHSESLGFGRTHDSSVPPTEPFLRSRWRRPRRRRRSVGHVHFLLSNPWWCIACDEWRTCETSVYVTTTKLSNDMNTYKRPSNFALLNPLKVKEKLETWNFLIKGIFPLVKVTDKIVCVTKSLLPVTEMDCVPLMRFLIDSVALLGSANIERNSADGVIWNHISLTITYYHV